MAMSQRPPRVPDGVYRGLLYGLPITLALWALILWALL